VPSYNTLDREIERIARESYGKLVALLTAEFRFRDLTAAEDALSDALLKALTRWQDRGIPDSPEAWLLTTARRRFLDEARRKRIRALHTPELQGGLPVPVALKLLLCRTGDWDFSSFARTQPLTRRRERP
jgi:predicted RNA polymerase sigma factor